VSKLFVALFKRAAVTGAVCALAIWTSQGPATVPVARPGPPSPGTVPPSIASDCSVDVTDALNQFVASLPGRVDRHLRRGRVLDNDFLGACAPYVALGSDLVLASGNIVSVC